MVVLLCGANYASASPHYNKFHNINHHRTDQYTRSASSEKQLQYLRDIEEDVFNRLRMRMQRNLILRQLPTELLPPELLNADESEEDQEMIEDLDLLENTGKKDDIDLEQIQANGIELMEDDETEPSMEGWLKYFKPMYIFLSKYYRSFNLRQRKIEQSWMKLQEKKNAAKEEESDARVGDFEQESEQREIIFLDEGNFHWAAHFDDEIPGIIFVIHI